MSMSMKKLVTLCAVGALAASGLLSSTGVAAAAGEQITSYYPRPGVTGPTYQTEIAAINGTPAGVDEFGNAVDAEGNVLAMNGQDYDHYCVADWYTKSVFTPGTYPGGTNGAIYRVSSQTDEQYLAGSNGLLYTNEFPQNTGDVNYRVVWATDFATENSTLVLKFGDNWTPGNYNHTTQTMTPLSEDPAVLLSQIEIVSGASKFRRSDWGGYTTGFHNLTGTDYAPGPYTGVDLGLFALNPNPTTTTVDGFNDPYYVLADQYVANTDPADPDSFYNRISYDAAARTLTIDLRTTQTRSLISINIPGFTNDLAAFGTDTYELDAAFYGHYLETHPENTVCYPTTVTWNKVDEQSRALLAGSEWSVAPTGTATGESPLLNAGGRLSIGAQPFAVTETNQTDLDAAAGVFEVTRESSGAILVPGSWALTETAAPAGYTGAATGSFVLDFANQSVDVGDLVNNPIPAPPVVVDPPVVDPPVVNPPAPTPTPAPQRPVALPVTGAAVGYCPA